MRIYISADIEGIAGVVSKAHTQPGGYEYESARNWMTATVVAACEAAQAAGVTDIVVSDSHGNGLNLRPDPLPDHVQLVRSWPRPLGMMQGIELGRYDGVFLIGYHGGAANADGVLSHTISSEHYQSVQVDGVEMSEADISAMIAAYHGAPLLLIAGDNVVVDEVRARHGPVAAAVLKQAVGTTAAIGPSPTASYALVRTAVAQALAAPAPAPPTPTGPHDIVLRLRTRLTAEWMAYLGPVERVDAFTIRYQARDVPDLSRFLMFLPFAKQILLA